MIFDKMNHDHHDIKASINRIRELVSQDIAAQADAISREIIAISSAIKIHLRYEDDHLYPMLAKSDKRQVADLARSFQVEMGKIAAPFAKFVEKWCVAANLRNDPQTFRNDANVVLRALVTRIAREEKELYPLARP